jgi:hypothetical protein
VGISQQAVPAVGVSGITASGGISMIGNITRIGGNITASLLDVLQLVVVQWLRLCQFYEGGIGPSDGSEVELLRFSGTGILFCTVTNAAAFPINASSIILSNTSLTITT